MTKSRIGGVAVVLIGASVLALELIKPTIGGWLWLIVGGFAVVLGTLNILGVGRADESE